MEYDLTSMLYNDVVVVTKSVFPSFPPKVIDIGRSSILILSISFPVVS